MSPYLSLGLAVIVFALSGCGGGGGGGGTSPSGASQPGFDGSGSEIAGGFSFKVTASSGLYASEYYGPVGLTGFVWIFPNGGNTISLTRNGLGSVNQATVTLVPDAATRTYQGALTYVSSAGGSHNGKHIDEVWTLNFDGAIANLSVTAGVDDDNDDGTPPTATGTMLLDLQTPWAFNDSGYTTFYGKQTAYSSDVRYVGQSGILELEYDNPGTVIYFYTDGAENRNDAFYVEGLWKEGNTLVGGGYYDGGYGDWLDRFCRVRITLNSAGFPVSATASIWNTTTDALTTVAHQDYLNEAQADSLINQAANDYDLAVTAVTAGGDLEGMFGPAGTLITDELYYSQVRLYTSTFAGGISLDGGWQDGNQWVYVLWDGNQYDYGQIPGYDMDSLASTQERWTIRLTIDANRVYTGGTASLQVYDASDTLVSTESMAFTLNAGPVINSALTASGTVGSAFSYTISARHSPSAFSATGLPAGLGINAVTGAITGTPTASGTFNVGISATNAAGTGTRTLVVTIAPL